MSASQNEADAFRIFELEAHNRIAEGYEAFFSEVTNHAIEPLLNAAAVTRDSRVLDVATGPGDAAFRAVTRGAPMVIGVDLADRMLALAKAKYPTIDFRLGDAENLPIADQSVDAVLSNFGIGHFPRPERALSEFNRVLVPGGAVAVSWWDTPIRHRLNGIFFDAISAAGATQPKELPKGPPVFRFSDSDELSSALREAGFTGISVLDFACHHSMASPEVLWRGILHGTVRTSVGIRHQSTEIQEQIRSAFDQLVKTYAVKDGIKIPVAFKIASARKPLS